MPTTTTKSKIELTIENDRKVARRVITHYNIKGEISKTEELSVKLFVPSLGSTYNKGCFEVYIKDAQDEELYYAEGGIWIEYNEVTDYDGVYELRKSLKPLMSALHLNTKDIFTDIEF